MGKREPTSNDYALAWLRIAIGVLFLIFAQYKILEPGFLHHGGFEGWIHRFLHGQAYPFMAPLLAGVVLRHADLFAHAVAYGELCIGLALAAGILVRLASLFGFLYMMTLLFASNYPGLHAPVWEYFGASLNHLVLALCFAAFVMCDSARVWSVPALLWRRPKGRGRSGNETQAYPGSSNVFGK